MPHKLSDITKYAVGVIALTMLNLLAIVFDGSLIQQTYMVDLIVIGAYLGVSVLPKKTGE